MLSGEAAHPAVTSTGTWCLLGKQMPTCPYLAKWCWGYCGFWVPQPLSVRHRQPLLALDLPSQGLSFRVVHRHPSAGSLGGNCCVSHDLP